MTDLVEQLRAQAVELRDVAAETERFAQAAEAPTGRMVADAERLASLADLIDGMLERHRHVTGWRAAMLRSDCSHCPGSVFPCPDLKDLATHVSAVLSGYTQTAREAQ